MGTNVSNFQNNAKNSNIILTSESNEMEFSKEVKTVSSFKNSDFGELKIIIIDEEPYFIGSPIASFLGYTNPRKAIRDHVDEDDRLIMKVTDTQGWNETFRPYTPNTKILIINESGLYSLIFGSKMDFAKKFKKWVTSEVLPSIRKTGSYSITPKDYPSALRALADEIDAKNRAIAERAQAEAERQQAIKTIEEQRPDVEFAESFKKVDHENMWLIRDIAKKLEQNGIIIAEKNLRLFLEEVKFMFRNGQGRWELYSDIVKNKFGVYRSYFVDKYSGERVNQQTIYMTGAGYEATLKGIKEKCRGLFLKYGKFEDPNFLKQKIGHYTYYSYLCGGQIRFLSSIFFLKVMIVEDYIIELKSSLRSFDKRDLIDEVSIYKWVEIALKKFGGDITMRKEAVVDVKRGQARMPGDYFDLILAFKCDFKGYEVPEGDKVIPELQNTIAWKERTERSYRWCSCNECCKEECEKVIVEKFYINTHDRDHEVRCYYDRPVMLGLAKPMLRDSCLSKCRNKVIKDSPYEINIVNGFLYANFDGPIYMQYRSLPFDGESNIIIPDTPQGLVLDYVDNFVKMRFFEELMYNAEAQGAADLFKLYAQQDLVKLKNAKTELKMMGMTLKGMYEPLRRRRAEFEIYTKAYPVIDNILKLV